MQDTARKQRMLLDTAEFAAARRLGPVLAAALTLAMTLGLALASFPPAAAQTPQGDTPPRATAIWMSSDNANPRYAKLGDTVTVTIDTHVAANLAAAGSEPSGGERLVSVSVNGTVLPMTRSHPPPGTAAKAKRSRFTFTVDDDTPEGLASASYGDFQLLAAHRRVTIDKTPPTVTRSFSTSNANGLAVAAGDKVTLRVTAAEEVALDGATISGTPVSFWRAFSRAATDPGTLLTQSATAVAVRGDRLYALNYQDNTLRIYDRSVPAAPRELGMLQGVEGSVAIGGPRSIFVQGDYAYVAAANADAFTIVDVSDPASPSQAGTAKLDKLGNNLADPSAVFVQGNVAYVVSPHESALHLFDVSDPSSPSPVGDIRAANDQHPLTGILDVHVQDDHAYLVSTVTGTALIVVDVSDPAAPLITGTARRANPGNANQSRAVFARGDLAFVATLGTSSLEIYDVSNPRAPALKGRASVGSPPKTGSMSLEVQGDYAYISSDNTQILQVMDVADPEHPRLVAETGYGAASTHRETWQTVAVHGKQVWVASSTAVAPAALVTDPTVYTAKVTADDRHISERVGWLDSGVTVRDPAGNSPLVLADRVLELNAAARVSGIWLSSDGADPRRAMAGDTITVTVATSDRAFVFPATAATPSTPEFPRLAVTIAGTPLAVTKTYPWRQYPDNISRFTYTVTSGSPKGVVTASYRGLSEAQPARSVTVDPAPPPGTFSLRGTRPGYRSVAAGDRLALSVTSPNLVPAAVTVARRTVPVTATTVPLGSLAGADGTALDGPTAVFVLGDHAYVTAANADSLVIVDISDPANPRQTGRLAHGTGGALLREPAAVAVRDHLAFVAAAGSDALEIVNVEDPAAPFHVGVLEDGTNGATVAEPSGIALQGNYAYMAAAGANAVAVVDVSNPAQPTQVGSVSGPYLTMPRAVAARGNYLFVAAEGADALVVVDISDPTAPRRMAQVVDGSLGARLDAPRALALQGNYAYVTAFGSDSLQVVDISRPVFPRPAGVIAAGRGVRLDGPLAVHVAGKLAYVAASRSDALQVIDVSNPNRPLAAHALTQGANGALLDDPRGVFVRDGRSYVAAFGSDALQVAQLEYVGTLTATAAMATEDIDALAFSAVLTDSAGRTATIGDPTEVLGIWLESSNPNPRYAKAGDTVTVTVATNRKALILPAGPAQPATPGRPRLTVSVGGQVMPLRRVFPVGGGAADRARFSFAVDDSTPEGAVRVYYRGFGTLSSLDSVTVDRTPPTATFEFTAVHVNKPGPGGIANQTLEPGDALTLTMTPSEEVALAPTGTSIVGRTVSPHRVLTHAGSLTAAADGSSLDGATAVFVLGDQAYVAARDGDALSVVDISDPAAPAQTGTLRHGAGGALLDGATAVFVQGNHAYVAAADSHALEIVDVSDPARPAHVGAVRDGEDGAALRGAAAVFVRGRHAYIAAEDSGALTVIDIADPARPTVAGVIRDGDGGAALAGPRGVFVQGSHAYVAAWDSDALAIIDVSDPSRPRHAGTLRHGAGGAELDGPQAVFALGSHAYVALTGSGALAVVDISDPTSPRLLDQRTRNHEGVPFGTARGVFVRGDYAYVTAGTALQVIDVSDPGFIRAAGSYSGSGGALAGATAAFVQGDHAFVAAANADSLHVIDIGSTRHTLSTHANSAARGRRPGDLPHGAILVDAARNPAFIVVDSDDRTPQQVVSLELSSDNPDPRRAAAGDRVTVTVTLNNAGFVHAATATQPATAAVPLLTVTAGGKIMPLAKQFPLGTGIGTTAVFTFEVDADTPAGPLAASYRGFNTLSHLAGVTVDHQPAPVTVRLSASTAAGEAIAAGDTLTVHIDGGSPTAPASVTIGGVSAPVTPRLSATGGLAAPASGKQLADSAALVNPQSIFVAGNHAYVAAAGSDALEIINVTDPATPSHAGKIGHGAGGAALDGASAVFVQGDHAYLAATDSNALEIIDVSDPSSPSHAGKIEHGSDGALLLQPRAVFVQGHRAVVAAAGSNALTIIDVSDPAQPQVTATIAHDDNGALLREPRGVFVRGRHAYVAASASNALTIIDISNPTLPRHVGSLSHGTDGALLSGARAVFVQGDQAYVAAHLSDALQVIDVSDPTRPRPLAQLRDGGAALQGPTAVFVQGSLAYVTSSASNALQLIDISDPAAPRAVGKLRETAGGRPLTEPSAVFVRGNIAYLAVAGTDSVQLAELDRIATLSAAEFAGKHVGQLDYEVALPDGRGGTARHGRIPRVTDLRLSSSNHDPRLALPGDVVTVTVNSDRPAYVASAAPDRLATPTRPLLTVAAGGTVIPLEAVAPQAAGRVTRFTFTVAPDTPSGPLSATYRGFDRLSPLGSVTVATKPLAASAALTTSSADGHLVAAGDVITLTVAAPELETAEATIGGTPVALRRTASHVAGLGGEPGAGDPTGLFLHGKHAYLTTGEPGTLSIIDLSDPAMPRLAGRLADGDGGAPLAGAAGVFVAGRHAFVAAARAGALAIIDIENPAAPRLAGSIAHGNGSALLAGARSVYVQGNHAYVAAEDANALQVIEVSDPAKPLAAGRIVNVSGGAALLEPRAVFVQGDHAFVAAAGSNALTVIDISDPTQPAHAATLTSGRGGTPLTEPSAVFVLGSHAYLTARGADALHVIDIADPTQPSPVGLAAGSAGLLDEPGAVFVAGNTAYVAAMGADELQLVDVSNPAAPTLSTRVEHGTGGAALESPSAVFARGDHVVVAASGADSLAIMELGYGGKLTATAPLATAHLQYLDYDVALSGPGGNQLRLSNIPRVQEISIRSDHADPRYARPGNWVTVTVRTDIDSFVTAATAEQPSTAEQPRLTAMIGGQVMPLTRPIAANASANTVTSYHFRVGEDTPPGQVTASYRGFTTDSPFATVTVDTGPPSGSVTLYGSGADGSPVAPGDTITLMARSPNNTLTEATIAGSPVSLSPGGMTVGSARHGTAADSPALDGAAAVFYRAGYAYVAAFEAGALEILDVSNPTDPRHAGKLSHGAGAGEPPLAGAAAVFVQGDYAYVAAAGSGALTVIDVREPARPQFAGALEHGAGNALLDGARGVFARGDYAYVAAAAANALTVVDISDPAAPVLAGQLRDGEDGAKLRSPQGVFVAGNYAYLAAADSGAMAIIDVSDPTRPRHAGTATTGMEDAELTGASAVFVQGRFAYLTAATADSFHVFDVTDPTRPRAAGILRNAAAGSLDEPRGLFVSGNHAYIAATGADALLAVDVTDPAAPRLTATVGDAGGALGQPAAVFVAGSHAYLAARAADSLAVIALGQLGTLTARPVHAGSPVADLEHGVVATDATGHSAQIGNIPRVRDMWLSSSNANPRRATTGDAVTLAVAMDRGTVGRLATAGEPATAARPALTVSIGSTLIPVTPTSGRDPRTGMSTFTFTVDGNTPEGDVKVAYRGFDRLSALTEVRVDKTAPAASVELSLPERQGTLIATDDLIAMTVTPSEEVAPSSVLVGETAVSLERDIALVGRLADDSELLESEAVFVSGNHAYVVASESQSLSVINVANPAAPRRVGIVRHGADGAQLESPGEVFVAGDHAYVADYVAGVLGVFDVSDPAAPRHVGALRHGSGGALLEWGEALFVQGNYAYVAAGRADVLTIVDISDPFNPRPAAAVAKDAGDNALDDVRSVFVHGNHAYLTTDDATAVLIVDVSDPRQPRPLTTLGGGNGDAPRHNFEAVFVRGEQAFVTTTNPASLQVMDVSDPAAPVVTGSLTLGAYPHQVFVRGDFAYVLHESHNELSIVNVADPANLTFAGTIGYDDSHMLLDTAVGLFVHGEHIYVTTFDSGALEIFAAAPALRGELTATAGHAGAAVTALTLSGTVQDHAGHSIQLGSDHVGAANPNRNPSATALLSDREQSVPVTTSLGYLANVADAIHDPDGDTLTLGASLLGGGSLPDWLETTPDGSGNLLFTATPPPGSEGVYQVVISAADGHGGTPATVDWLLTVLPSGSNNPPFEALPLGTAVAAAGARNYRFEVPAGTFADADGDALALTATRQDGSPLPSWLRFAHDAQSNRYVFSAETVGAAGSYVLMITARDDFGDQAGSLLTLNVIAGDPGIASVNTDIVLSLDTETAADTDTREAGGVANGDSGDPAAAGQLRHQDANGRPRDFGSAVTIEIKAGDGQWHPPAASGVTTAVGTYGSMQVDADGAWSYTLDNSDPDTERLAAGSTATDDFHFRLAAGAPDTAPSNELPVAITVHGANDAPVVSAAIPSQSLSLGGSFYLSVPETTFQDVDEGDRLSLSAHTEDGGELPSWLSFNRNMRDFAFTATPREGLLAESAYTVLLIATDSSGTETRLTITLNLTAGNNPPTLNRELPNHLVRSATPFVLTMAADTFADPDGDLLDYAFESEPDLSGWLSMDRSSGNLTGTAPAATAGIVARVTVSAADGNGGTATGEFTLAIGDPNVSPVATTALAEATAFVDFPFEWLLPANAFADGNLDELAVTARTGAGPLPGWLSFDGEWLRGTPTEAMATVLITLTARDRDNATGTTLLKLTVLPAPDIRPRMESLGNAMILTLPYVEFSPAPGESGQPCMGIEARSASANIAADWSMTPTAAALPGCPLPLGQAGLPSLDEDSILRVPDIMFDSGRGDPLCFAMSFRMLAADSALILTDTAASDCPPAQ